MIRVHTDTDTYTDVVADKIDIRLNGILLVRKASDSTIVEAYADGAWVSAKKVETE
jgi:hypothetical protein